MRLGSRFLTLVAFGGLTSLLHAQAAPAPPAQAGPEVREGFNRVRTATARYQLLDSAVAAGYAREVPRCYSDGHHGAMGYHHVNRSLVDRTVEVERPEILLYERLPDGGYQLNGVEYIVPYRVWPRDSVAPILMGLPLKQEDQLKLWYLHMWVWNDNPAGLFADWHPHVKCPAP